VRRSTQKKRGKNLSAKKKPGEGRAVKETLRVGGSLRSRRKRETLLSGGETQKGGSAKRAKRRGIDKSKDEVTVRAASAITQDIEKLSRTTGRHHLKKGLGKGKNSGRTKKGARKTKTPIINNA